MREVKAGGVRQSVIAGKWYPGQPDALRRTLEGYLADAEKVKLEGELKALISPHAGYAYSGPTAAYAYKQLEDGPAFDTVAVLSPIHQAFLGRFAVTRASYYETPLGLVEVDAELVEALGKDVTLNRIGFDGEHSLEIQLPFLQHMLGEFTLLPVMMGDQGLRACRELSAAVTKVVGEEDALLVASSDLAHLHDYQEVVAHDRYVQKFVNDFDPEGLASSLAKNEAQACGGGPIVTVMLAAKERGADTAKVLRHMNSGDVTGMRTPGQYTVGYLAGVIYRRGGHGQ